MEITLNSINCDFFQLRCQIELLEGTRQIFVCRCTAGVFNERSVSFSKRNIVKKVSQTSKRKLSDSEHNVDYLDELLLLLCSSAARSTRIPNKLTDAWSCRGQWNRCCGPQESTLRNVSFLSEYGRIDFCRTRFFRCCWHDYTGQKLFNAQDDSRDYKSRIMVQTAKNLLNEWFLSFKFSLFSQEKTWNETPFLIVHKKIVFNCSSQKWTTRVRSGIFHFNPGQVRKLPARDLFLLRCFFVGFVGILLS